MFVAMVAAPVAPAALPVYGGPTFSTATGGYIAEDPLEIKSFMRSAHVNEAGIAAVTANKVDGSREPLEVRAIKWSASMAPTELAAGDSLEQYSYAERINAAGTIVGWTSGSAPTRWAATGTAATILQDLGHGGGLVDLNDVGTAVGGVTMYYGDYAYPLPARWEPSGTAVTMLGMLAPTSEGLNSGSARAINAAGVAVGVSGKADAAGNPLGWRAVRWDPSGTAATELGNLGTTANYGQYPDGWTESLASAINSAGMAVGYVNVYDESGQLLRQHVPVRWDASGTPTELGSISDKKFSQISDSPAALNDAGTAVGWTFIVDPTYRGTRAVRWDASGTAATELGNLGTVSEFTYSEAVAVNAAGTAVGWAAANWNEAGTLYEEHAVYWGADGIAIDLNTLIDPESGWLRLERALDISDTGWIVGTGLFDADGAGGQRAYRRHFLMQVPATAVLPGDFNLDGTVDAADYVVWRKGLGTIYDQNDYDLWRALFGASLGPGSGSSLPSLEPLSAAVPEPAALALVAFALAPFLFWRKRINFRRLGISSPPSVPPARTPPRLRVRLSPYRLTSSCTAAGSGTLCVNQCALV